MAEPTMREGPAGYHYYKLDSDCPRKWYLKYRLGLQYEFTGSPLILGGAIHEGARVYYENNYNIEKALERFAEVLTQRHGEYEHPNDYDTDLEDGLAMLRKWDETWGAYDQEHYEILEVEKEHSFRIGPNEDFLFVIRPDRIVKDRETGMYYVVDLKTTRWGISQMATAVERDDQMTAYVWGARKAYPDLEIEAAFPDIVYKRSSVVKAERPGKIVLTKYDFLSFELNMVGRIAMLSQRIQGLEHFPNELLFPRNGSLCSRFGCEYLPICRKAVGPEEIPLGYTRDPWVLENAQLPALMDFNLTPKEATE